MSAAARGWRRPGLIARIAIALAVVALAPLLLVAWQLVSVNREAMTEQVLRSHTVAARSTAERIESFLDARTALAASLAASLASSPGSFGAASAERAPAGRDALVSSGSPEARRILGESLSAWADLGLLAIAVVDSGGEEVLRVQLTSDAARAAAEKARGLSPQPGVRGIGDRRELLLAVDTPLGGGAVRLLADGSGLGRLLRPDELGESAVLVLASRDGGVLAGPLGSLDELPRTLVQLALGGRARGAQEALDAAGEEFLGAWAPVAGTSWVVISRQPAAVAQAAARRMRQRALGVLAAALALVALVAQGAWLTVVQPLRRLLAAQRALAGLEGAMAKGTEIEQLESGFAALAQGVKDRDALSRVFLGRFQVVEVLGTGGMGMVFRGWDPRLERPVALKTLRVDSLPGEGPKEERIAALLREATTIARLSHPHIVAVYDAIASPSGAFMAMELVEGRTLEMALWQGARLDPDEVLCLGLAVARALELAHAHGIVHRDIKPGNVLLGDDGSIKVGDFGVAALVSAAAGAPGDRIFGTPGFIPPEVYQGDPFDGRGDVFSLGVLLYEALSGQQPFAAERTAEVVQRTLVAPIRPLREIVPGLPREIDDLIRLLLERDPALRPDAAGAAHRLADLARLRGSAWKPPEMLGTPLAAARASRNHTQWIPTLAGARRQSLSRGREARLAVEPPSRPPGAPGPGLA